MPILMMPQSSLAGAGFEEGKYHVYGTFDAFLPANAGNGLRDDMQAGMNQWGGMGYASVGSIETTAAVGGRLGVMVNLAEEFDLGISGGYIVGPNSNCFISLAGGGKSAVVSDKREVSFIRFLVEPTVNAKMSEYAAFHLAAGLGIAEGQTEETFTCMGTACLTNTGHDISTWCGFTWEVSPYFTIKDFILGARYAGFPEFKGNSSNAKIEWTSAGLFTGFKF